MADPLRVKGIQRMPLPIAHGLLGASIVAATLPYDSPARNWKPLALGAALAYVPDLDYFLPAHWHRSFTHSLIFALLISLVCFAAWGATNIRLAFACAGATLSHALLDFATTRAMPGVELFWPLSTRRFGLGLIDYYSLTGIDPTYFMTKDVAADLLKAAKVELIVFIPVFLFVLAVKWSVSKRPHS
jgi:membrane-bound metal-dependent hydrolase YbcI (DUF457 family)